MDAVDWPNDLAQAPLGRGGGLNEGKASTWRGGCKLKRKGGLTNYGKAWRRQ